MRRVGGAVHQALAGRRGRCPRRRRGRESPCGTAQRRWSSALTAAASAPRPSDSTNSRGRPKGKSKAPSQGPGLGQQRLESRQASAGRPGARSRSTAPARRPRATTMGLRRARRAAEVDTEKHAPIVRAPAARDRRRRRQPGRGRHRRGPPPRPTRYSRRHELQTRSWSKRCAAASSSPSTAARWPSSTPTARVHSALGDIERPIFPRSAVKVLQALPLVASGAADRWR